MVYYYFFKGVTTHIFTSYLVWDSVYLYSAYLQKRLEKACNKRYNYSKINPH